MNQKKKQERWIKKNDDLNRVLDRQAQYSRRNCILVHGMKESENEDTDTVVTETLNELLQEKLTDIDIDRSHRIGRLKKGKQSRPIIIKFARYNIRNRVFKNKKKVERHWYQHNREPHSKTNANAN